MNKINTAMAGVLGFLAVLAGGMWMLILLKDYQATSGSTQVSQQFIEFPYEPPSGSGANFIFLINKPISVGADTMVCLNIVDLDNFWTMYDAGVNAGNDSQRRNAVLTALAASCKITQQVTYGTIFFDDRSSPDPAQETILFRAAGDPTEYYVRAYSVSP